jgi:Ferrous iron transport protein B
MGNWPGVTVEKKVGAYRLGEDSFELVDLPCNIVDAFNLERKTQSLPHHPVAGKARAGRGRGQHDGPGRKE